MNMREVERPFPQFRARRTTAGSGFRPILVVVYNTTLVKPEQMSLLDLAQPQWKDKLPSRIPAASTFTGVSVIKTTFGDERTKQFLQGHEDQCRVAGLPEKFTNCEAVAKARSQPASSITTIFIVIWQHSRPRPSPRS